MSLSPVAGMLRLVACDPWLVLLSECSGKRQVKRSETVPLCARLLTLLRRVRPDRPLMKE
jgi:hypothetical protein